MQEHRLEIAGHTLIANEYNETFETPPVIFIHGITASLAFGETAIPQGIRDTFHWFSLSLPGHFPALAPADFSPQDLTPEFMADIMAQAIDQLTGGIPAVLVGHSTGGYAAYCVAHHKPERVRGLVMVSAFAVGRWGGTLGIVQTVARFGLPLFRAYMRFWQAAFPRFRFSYRLLGNDQEALLRSEVFARSAQDSFPFAQQSDHNALYAYFRRMPQTDIRPWLREIQTPAHVIHGNKDGIIPPAHGEEAHQLLPNSRFTWIDGSGHLPMLERRSEYETAVTQAIQEFTAPTAPMETA